MTTQAITTRAGPIAITGASGQIGTALLRRLGRLPNEVRALGREDDLRAAFVDAEVVVHLAGTLRPTAADSYTDANLATVERTVEALAGSAVDRVVFLSYVGADPASRNEYLRAKGQAEAVLRGCGRDVVVFRCTHVFGPPEDPGPTAAAFIADGCRSVAILGRGRQRVAPVFREDVVDAIARAVFDPGAYHGRFDLAGPEEMTLDAFALALNRHAVALRHVPFPLARALAHVVPGLTPTLVDVMLADSVGDPRRAVRTFGLELRALEEIYQPTERAAA